MFLLLINHYNTFSLQQQLVFMFILCVSTQDWNLHGSPYLQGNLGLKTFLSSAPVIFHMKQ